MAAFDITYSEAHVLRMVRAGRRYRPSKNRDRVLTITLGTAILAFFGVCVGVLAVFAEMRLFAVLFTLLLLLGLVLILFARRIDEWLLIRRLRQSPLAGHRFRIEISDTGFSTASALSQSSTAWEMFTSALRVHDGILLYHGPRVFYWLPFDCLVEGTPEDTEAVLRRNITDYRTA